MAEIFEMMGDDLVEQKPADINCHAARNALRAFATYLRETDKKIPPHHARALALLLQEGFDALLARTS